MQFQQEFSRNCHLIAALVVIEIAFGANHKEGETPRESILTTEVDVATTHDVEGARFQTNLSRRLTSYAFPVVMRIK